MNVLLELGLIKNIGPFLRVSTILAVILMNSSKPCMCKLAGYVDGSHTTKM